MRCQACPFNILNKASTIKQHCDWGTEAKRSNHFKKLHAWLLRRSDDSSLKESLIAYYEAHPDEKFSSNVTNPDEMVYRYRALETFLATGTPPSRMDEFRPLLQRSGFALTSASHLTHLIPRVLDREDALLNFELREQYLCIGFDGTSRLGEAINIAARWCSISFNLEKRLIDFTTLLKHVDNVQLAA